MRSSVLSARDLSSKLGILFVAVLFTASFFGCESSDDSSQNSVDNNMNGGASTPAVPPLVQAGEDLVVQNHCGSCHEPNGMDKGVLSGQMSPRPGTKVFGANLTPDSETGIGDFSDRDIATAIRKGLDDQGEELCPTMPRFKNLTDLQIKAIIAYLRSLPPVKSEIPESVCPPVKPRESSQDMIRHTDM